jgi:shikimate 5-dehydrogenase
MNDPLIFDIVYQPLQTMLLFLAKLVGCKTLNGAPMNLEQAVIAFKKAISASALHEAKDSKIRDLMRKIW